MNFLSESRADSEHGPEGEKSGTDELFNDAAIAEKLEKTVKLIEGLRKMAVYLPMHSLLHRIFSI